MQTFVRMTLVNDEYDEYIIVLSDQFKLLDFLSNEKGDKIILIDQQKLTNESDKRFLECKCTDEGVLINSLKPVIPEHKWYKNYSKVMKGIHGQ